MSTNNGLQSLLRTDQEEMGRGCSPLTCLANVRQKTQPQRIMGQRTGKRGEDGKCPSVGSTQWRGGGEDKEGNGWRWEGCGEDGELLDTSACLLSGLRK